MPHSRASPHRIAFNISAAEALNRDNYYLRLCLFVQLLAESLYGAFVLIGETRGKIVDEKVACGRRVIVLRLCGHFVVIGKAWGEKTACRQRDARLLRLPAEPSAKQSKVKQAVRLHLSSFSWLIYRNPQREQLQLRLLR